MKLKKENLLLIIVCLAITGLGILSRNISEVPNLTALPAIALLLGAFAKRKSVAIAVVLSAMLISDFFFFGFYTSVWAVYLSYILIVFMGSGFNKLNSFFGNDGSSAALSGLSASVLAVGSTVLFFLLTNAAVWMESFLPGTTHASMYSPDLSGLMASYAAGLAFIRQYGYPELLGTLLFAVPSFVLYSQSIKRAESSLVAQEAKSN